MDYQFPALFTERLVHCQEPTDASALDGPDIGQTQCDVAGAEARAEQLVERLDVVDAERLVLRKALPTQGNFQLVDRFFGQGSGLGITAHGTFSIMRGTAGWETY
jgi:hypothetical protein